MFVLCGTASNDCVFLVKITGLYYSVSPVFSVDVVVVHFYSSAIENCSNMNSLGTL